MAMHSTVTVRGSWGNISVDRASGAILFYDDSGMIEAGDIGYRDILYFIPETLAPGRDDCLDRYGETDILFTGFVDDRGTVVMPMLSGDDGAIDPHGLLA